MKTFAEINPTHPTRRPRKLLVAVGVLLGLVLLCPTAGVVYIWIAVSRIHNDAIAEVDRLDPGWRIEEIEARREVLPDASNGALRVAEIMDALPADIEPKAPPEASAPRAGDGTPVRTALDRGLFPERPNVLLSDEEAEAVRAEAARKHAAILLARKMIRYPTGRNRIHWRPDMLQMSLDYAENARNVARLLNLDVVSRSQDGDADGALESCLAMLNVGRSLGDEPIAITQLVRIAITRMAANDVERVLARGEPSVRMLSALQSALARERDEPLHLYALRGERALFFRQVQNYENGTLPFPGTEAGTQGWSRFLTGPQGRLFYRYNQGLGLHRFTQVVEISKAPPAKQAALWNAFWPQTYPKNLLDKVSALLVHLFLPAMDAISNASAQCKATLGACIVTLAAEQYRRTTGAWPTSTREIETILSVKLPVDPYSGKPYRLKETDESLIVYSIGPDLRDNGGNLNNVRAHLSDIDLGYKLWDLSHRRLIPTSIPPPTESADLAPSQ